jgi:hypothetical protein
VTQGPAPAGDPAGSSDDEPRFTVAAVASRLGVAPATLRTWDRRYGVGPSAHAFGSHRRYTSRDIERLLVMRRLVVDGVPPSEAARVALRTDRPTPAPTADLGPSAEEPLPGSLLPDEPVGDEPAAGAEPPVSGVAPAGGGGGRVLAMPGATPEVRGLARAAMALDARTMTAVVRESLRAHGVASTWHHLLVPVLHAIGERWEATGVGVDVEHLLSESALVGLREARAAASPLGEPRVVLCSAADDYHALPVHVLAAALAEQRIGARVLGGAVPPAALSAAVRRVRPAVTFCWSSMPSTGDPRYLDAVPALAPATSVVVGGRGWDEALLPRGVEVVRDVPHAVAVIAARLGR